MAIPALGPLTPSEDDGEQQSSPTPVPVLDNRPCVFSVSADETGHTDVHDAVAAFLALDRTALSPAEPHVFAYYEDIVALVDGDFEPIDGPSDVWRHVIFGSEVHIGRGDDDHVYLSVECECAWEPEHGLQLVFRDGRTITKVGPYDGHLTNEEAYGGDDLADVVYVRAR